MYKPHATFIQPPSGELRVWRYMDFTKLVDLLDSSALYFTRADKFEDAFEGSYPKLNVTGRFGSEGASEDRERLDAQMSDFAKNTVKFYAINCWHLNEHESAAMWRLYLQSNEGIAVQSTYGSLKDSLIDDEDIFLGSIKYIDYEKEWFDGSNLLAPYVHKRLSFEHEKEVRAVVCRFPDRQGLDWKDFPTIEHGLKIKVDLEKLINAIYVAPSSPGWFVELVKSVVIRFGFNFPVCHSDLAQQPVY
ncbi:hypothetical protein [Xanthomonas citri]|uniref:hypothetical protein n=1 Tax=Xanthomonas citri TaxID=346 RepID=UPI001CBB803C|nr:hypothetical protein [Xanthomonas citri]